MKRQCKFCGKEFEARCTAKLYCSESCRGEVERLRKRLDARKRWAAKRALRTPYQLTCEFCGVVFESRYKKKYCSAKCRWARKRSVYVRKRQPVVKEPKPKEKRQCEYCGKEFEARGTQKRFCGDECRTMATYERHGLNYRRDITCPICGKVFRSIRGKKYCSEACRKEAVRRQQVKYKAKKPATYEKKITKLELKRTPFLESTTLSEAKKRQLLEENQAHLSKIRAWAEQRRRENESVGT